MIRMRVLLIAGLLGVIVFLVVQYQATQGQREDFISYPFLDRAWRAAESEEWDEVESLTRYILERFPTQEEAGRLLTEALVRQDRFAEALEVAPRSAEADDDYSRQQLRLRWIQQGRPGGDRVASWLSDATPAERELLLETYSYRLQEEEGDEVTLRWLKGLQMDQTQALFRLRSVVADSLGEHRLVVMDLQHLSTLRRLDDEESLRLGLALLETGDMGGLRALIADEQSHNIERQLRRMAAERAIAREQPAAALGWLRPLIGEDPVPEALGETAWELARQTGEVSLVLRLARQLDRPCLETVDWLSGHDPGEALALLGDCDPAENPGRWLILAQRLEAVELMAGTPLAGEQEAQRRAWLINRWRQRQEYERALAWLGELPASTGTLRWRAEILQAQGHPDAAERWLEHFEQSGSPRSLSLATFLLVEQGEHQQALEILEDSFRTQPAQLDAEALTRFRDLLLEEQPFQPALAASLLEHLPSDERGELLVSLASAGYCDRLDSHLNTAMPGFTGDMARALCAEQNGRPGMAVVYYRRAIEAGAGGLEKSLAYALYEAGDPVGALKIWQQLPMRTLTRDDRLAAARSALDADRPALAEQFWRQVGLEESGTYFRLGAAIAASAGDSELALQRDRLALQYAPVAEHYYAAAVSARAAGETQQALAWLDRAVALAPDNARYRLDYGLMLSASENRDVRLDAIPHLEAAREEYASAFRLAESLAMRYAERGQQTRAMPLFREAMDLHQLASMSDQGVAEAFAPRQYAMQRSHESLGRRDSFTLAATWSPMSVGAVAGQPLSGENYQIAVWDHLLTDSQGNAGSTSVYARALSSAARRQTYFDSLGVGVGVRLKPWREQNINLYAELYHEQGLDGGPDRGLDLLLRATASFFDGGAYRNDWRPQQNRWQERSLYLDAAWFVYDSERQLMARYQHGYTFKLGSDWPHTLTAYGLVQGVAGREEEDFRVGGGFRWQLWHNDGRYDAFRGRLALRAEYTHALSGSLYESADGWLVGIEWNW